MQAHPGTAAMRPQRASEEVPGRPAQRPEVRTSRGGLLPIGRRVRRCKGREYRQHSCHRWRAQDPIACQMRSRFCRSVQYHCALVASFTVMVMGNVLQVQARVFRIVITQPNRRRRSDANAVKDDAEQQKQVEEKPTHGIECNGAGVPWQVPG